MARIFAAQPGGDGGSATKIVAVRGRGRGHGDEPRGRRLTRVFGRELEQLVGRRVEVRLGKAELRAGQLDRGAELVPTRGFDAQALGLPEGAEEDRRCEQRRGDREALPVALEKGRQGGAFTDGCNRNFGGGLVLSHVWFPWGLCGAQGVAIVY